MKITLSAKFIDSLMSLPFEQQHVVLISCKELMELDNEGIEAYEPAADAPELVHEIHANMNKRVLAARRREQRRCETTAVAFTAAPVVDEESKSGTSHFEKFKEAAKAISENAEQLSASERAEVKTIARSLIEVIDTLRTKPAVTESKPVTKPNKPHPRCSHSSKTKKVPINHFLKR